MKKVLIIVCCLLSIGAFAQEDENLFLRESQELLSDASLSISKDEFEVGEAKYRKSIALNPINDTGKYNLGNAYYSKEKNIEALKRFQEAAQVATTKTGKHKAFHNFGNSLMNEKMYKEAVEAYKNALRNNPTDDETRYNFALAKKMLEEEEKNGGDDNDKKDDESEDKNKDDEKKDGDDGDDEEKKDEGDDKEDENKGDKEDEKENPNDSKDKKEEEKKPEEKPAQGQLSAQQIKSLLEAMNNEEQKVQEKINAKKEKGANIKTEKDW